MRRRSARSGDDRRHITRRRAHDGRKQRRLRWRQRRRVLAEIAAGSGFDAVVAVAKIDGVEILLKDSLLGVALLQAEREHRFAHLPLEGSCRREAHRARQLLRNSAAAFANATGAHVAHGRADDADRIEAAVRVEAAILDGYDGIDHVPRDLIEGHVDALFGVEGKCWMALAVEHDRGLRAWPDAREVVRSSQLVGDGHREADDLIRRVPAAQCHHRNRAYEQSFSHAASSAGTEQRQCQRQKDSF